MVPSTRPSAVSPSSRSERAIPKSVTLAEPSGSSRTFCGLTSRCTIVVRVGGAERAGDLDRVGQRLVDRQPAEPPDAVLERLALDVLEDDVGPVVVLARVDHADDVRVRELRDGARLASEAFELVGILLTSRGAGA